MSHGTTEKIAEFAASISLNDIPTDVKNSTIALLADSLACALAGHQGEETNQLHAMASALGQSEESSVIGGKQISLAGATMMNGYLITAVTTVSYTHLTLPTNREV